MNNVYIVNMGVFFSEKGKNVSCRALVLVSSIIIQSTVWLKSS